MLGAILPPLLFALPIIWLGWTAGRAMAQFEEPTCGMFGGVIMLSLIFGGGMHLAVAIVVQLIASAFGRGEAEGSQSIGLAL